MLSSNTSAVSGDANYIEDVFSTWLYSGTGTAQSINNGIDLASKGGMVWTKSRTFTSANIVLDSVRGGTNNISTNTTAVASTDTGFHISSFNSNGYSLQGNAAVTNGSGNTYASWTFRKQPKFFDVVSYTGNGTNRTISHNLGSVPGCMIVKRLTGATANWQVYHRSLSNTQYIQLNIANAPVTNTNRWNSTTPTSTEFSIGTDITVNASGESYIAYLFAHDAGGFGLTGTDNVISCGTYTGDGLTTSVVSLGYEPQYVLLKRTSSTSDWFEFDTMRGMDLTDNFQLLSNSNAAEANYAMSVLAPTANGFTFPGSAAYFNTSGETWIYIAIRKGPMKIPTDATKVFSPVATTFTSGTTVATTNFPVDLVINTQRTKVTVTQNITRDRLRGEVYSTTTGTAAQAATGVYNEFSSNTSFLDAYTQPAYGSGITGTNAIYWNFRRAPSFFDIVCYTGDGTTGRNISHNLKAVPELMIVKERSAIDAWQVYSSGIANTEYLVLNATSAKATGASRWSSTTPTSSVFTIGSSSLVNESGQTYVNYLFSTCSGVSKVGSYTGTGTTKQIDCGFAAGARFVLIKRTDANGDWYMWDTARGIVSGNDPYLLLNTTTGESTTTDYIDTYSAGFELSSTAPAALNSSGGTYIFLAIA